MNKEQIIAILKENRDRLRSFHVRAFYLFGSVVRGDEKKTSDIDLLVEFEPDARIGLFEFSHLRRMLTEMLGCEVDLATPEALHKAVKGRIMEEAIRAV
ncbi:MAG TPA: nucleotidyltransferase family protein [Thermodesulfovibrionales bacterium]|jgi:predicted nucleotidyltransferase|nr:nucleotidyltransferase family protein [Thermodesulfovibrionales bacterium]